jgi:RimJ/RimL family protein N-acetyltransferase
MRKYKCLHQNIYKLGEYSIEPIRDQDKMNIRKWRNEQIHHLRQKQKLSKQKQKQYFKTIVSDLFNQEKPDQLLFSFLHREICVGYGGLVHINWEDKNAEVSFLMNTENIKSLEKYHWNIFLKLIDKIAFEELNLHKIFAYAYDVRPHLYDYLLENKYVLEARLKQHYFLNGKIFHDVVIHSKFNNLKKK